MLHLVGALDSQDLLSFITSISQKARMSQADDLEGELALIVEKRAPSLST